jgi:hypothetical protein
MAKKDGGGYGIDGHDLGRVRNRYELRVIEALRAALPKQVDFCGCTLCIEDVYAITLNRIPAHYIQTGAIVLHPPDVGPDQIEAHVRSAIDQVRAQPKHPR